MAKVKRGDRLSCAPCGREVVVNSCGISEKVIWCCGRPMKKVAKKKAAKKSAKKK